MLKATHDPTSTTRRDAIRFGAVAAMLLPAAARSAPNPDAELIRLCDRLVVNRALEQAEYQANPHKNDEGAPDPLNDEWFKISEQICQLDGPRTREGACAAARATLANAPLDQQQALECGDLGSWLSITCAKYLAGSVDPISVYC
jgi:hypothetical protein